MRGKTADQWFALYGQSHQNPLNKSIHWVCIPLILLSLVGLLWGIDLPLGPRWLNAGMLVLLAALGWYCTVSVPLAVGMTAVAAATVAGVLVLQALPVPLWISSAIIFVGAWIGQFVGHRIEGKKPSFFEDLQFLLVGPLWLLGAVYRRLGLRY